MAYTVVSKTIAERHAGSTPVSGTYYSKGNDMADENTIQYSATIGVSDTTIADITAAQAAVSAPDTARITTGGYYQPGADAEAKPFSVTFQWTD